MDGEVVDNIIMNMENGDSFIVNHAVQDSIWITDTYGIADRLMLNKIEFDD